MFVFFFQALFEFWNLFLKKLILVSAYSKVLIYIVLFSLFKHLGTACI